MIRMRSLNKQTAFLFASTALAALIIFSNTPSASAQVAGAEHMVIIGCDGMSPDGIDKADTPNMDRLIKEGASTFHARGVMPTSSSPNWASMIMGAGPEQHGVTSNDWMPDKYEIEPICKGMGGIFPTIYGVLREQKSSINIGLFFDWDDYGRLTERKAIDKYVDGNGPDDTVKQAVAYIKESKPQFSFIHLDHVDHAGHEFGHGTQKYYESVEHADRLIGEVLAALKDVGIIESTVVLVTSDHGGVGKGHGGATMAEIEIPWIISGPGVSKGKEIQAPVNTYDTASTVAHVFGVKQPECWIAKPVLSAFEK